MGHEFEVNDHRIALGSARRITLGRHLNLSLKFGIRNELCGMLTRDLVLWI